jgi:hypothetical protein
MMLDHLEIGWDLDLSNLCSCAIYDGETDTFLPSPECLGDCGEDTLMMWAEAIKPLFDAAETWWWRIDGLPLWNRTASGWVIAKNPADLLEGMTVRGEWHLRGFVKEDHIKALLSHHDAPTGGWLTARPATEEESDGLDDV